MFLVHLYCCMVSWVIKFVASLTSKSLFKMIFGHLYSKVLYDAGTERFFNETTYNIRLRLGPLTRRFVKKASHTTFYTLLSLTDLKTDL